MEAGRAGTGVVEAAVDAAVAGATAAGVAVARFDGAPAAVKARRRPAGVEELTLVAEVRVGADTAELVRRHVDARSTMLTVGLGARTGRFTPLTVVPLSTHTSNERTNIAY